MSGIQPVFRRTRVLPFSSAIVAALSFLVGLYIMGRVVWRVPSLHLDAAVFFAVLVLMLICQTRRIHRVYTAAAAGKISELFDPAAYDAGPHR